MNWKRKYLPPTPWILNCQRRSPVPGYKESPASPVLKSFHDLTGSTTCFRWCMDNRLPSSSHSIIAYWIWALSILVCRGKYRANRPNSRKTRLNRQISRDVNEMPSRVTADSYHGKFVANNAVSTIWFGKSDVLIFKDKLRKKYILRFVTIIINVIEFDYVTTHVAPEVWEVWTHAAPTTKKYKEFVTRLMITK